MVEPSVAVCLAGRLRGTWSAAVERSWTQHFLSPSYTLFAVVDEDEEAAAVSMALPIAFLDVQRVGETSPAVRPCTGGIDGRDGFNHVNMAKVALCSSTLRRKFPYSSFLPSTSTKIHPPRTALPSLASLPQPHRATREACFRHSCNGIFAHSLRLCGVRAP